MWILARLFFVSVTIDTTSHMTFLPVNTQMTKCKSIIFTRVTNLLQCCWLL